MAKQHLTPDGPRDCSADPTKPGGRQCKYGPADHFESLAEAESEFERRSGGPVPHSLVRPVGPPPPERFYHVLRASDLGSVQDEGLEPRIGDRSSALGEAAPRVYLFDSKISAEEGLMGWLLDEFDEDEELVLVSIPSASVGRPEPTYVSENTNEESGFDPSTEWTTDERIDAAEIRVEGSI